MSDSFSCSKECAARQLDFCNHQGLGWHSFALWKCCQWSICQDDSIWHILDLIESQRCAEFSRIFQQHIIWHRSQVRDAELCDIDQIDPSVSPELAAIVNRCLQKNVEERYGSITPGTARGGIQVPGVAEQVVLVPE